MLADACYAIQLALDRYPLKLNERFHHRFVIHYLSNILPVPRQICEKKTFFRRWAIVRPVYFVPNKNSTHDKTLAFSARNKNCFPTKFPVATRTWSKYWRRHQSDFFVIFFFAIRFSVPIAIRSKCNRNAFYWKTTDDWPPEPIEFSIVVSNDSKIISAQKEIVSRLVDFLVCSKMCWSASGRRKYNARCHCSVKLFP